MEVMSYVDVSHRADEVMCIGRMLKLTKLGIVVTGKEASYLMKYVFSQIERLKRSLRSLSIRIQGGESSSYNLADSYMLSPPRLLQTLSISGSKGLPHWVAGLHQLVKITLRETYLTGDALYALGNLRSLRCLRFLPKALAEGIIKFSAGEFSNLVHLFFQEDYIISVIFDHETAPRLETVVFDVKIITSLHGIRNLPSLKDLQIKGELRGEQAVQQAIADHPNSPDYESKIQGKDRYRYSPGLFVLCCICC